MTDREQQPPYDRWRNGVVAIVVAVVSSVVGPFVVEVTRTPQPVVVVLAPDCRSDAP